MNRYKAAAYLKIPVTLFDRMDRDGRMPRPKLIGKLRIWSRVALDDVTIPARKAPVLKYSDKRAEQMAKVVAYAQPVTVYVLGIPGFIKIGFTASGLAKRIAVLQTGCPHRIEVLAIIAGSRRMEAALHEKFRDYRAAGEWFRREGEVADWISGGCKL